MWGVGVLLLLALQCATALKLEYDGEVLTGGTLEWLLVGMEKSVIPAPIPAFPGSGASVIELNVTFSRARSLDASHVEAMIFHEEDLAYIGVHTPYTVLLCCDQDVYEAKACSKEQLDFTALATAVANRPSIYYQLVWFEPLQTSASLAARYEVQRAGLYYVIFVNCHASGVNPVSLKGRLTWINPSGYLSGSAHNLIPSFLALAGVYALCASLWIGVLYWRSDRVILLHHFITILFVLGFAASFSHASSLAAENQSGDLCIPCAVTWVVFGTLHALFLRLFALLLAMGLSIALPWWDLERRQMWGIVILCGAYVLAAGGQNMLVALSAVADNSGRQPVFLMLPVNLANTAFLISIFVELVRTIHMVRDDGELEKFRMYVSHLLFLFAVAAATLLFYIVQLLVQWRDVRDMTWQFEWLFDFVWEASMLLIVLTLAALWFPRSLIKSFAFYEREPLDWRPPRLVD